MKDCPHEEEQRGTVDPESLSHSQLLPALTHEKKKKILLLCETNTENSRYMFADHESLMHQYLLSRNLAF